MSATTHPTTRLAYDDVGTGQPVVFLHGLTFDRRTWQPAWRLRFGEIRTNSVDAP